MPRCKICRKKFEYVHNKFEKVCSDMDCRIAYAPELARNIAEINQRAWKQKKAVLKVEVPKKSNKSLLQDEINKLARFIDAKFRYACIDCGRELKLQVHGSHYHNVGSHEAVRFNLHNIHSSASDCNKYHGGRKEGYFGGLITRYGNDYALFVREGILHVPAIKLSAQDLIEKIKIVRGLIRSLDTFKFTDGQQGRDIMNKIIGIYEYSL